MHPVNLYACTSRCIIMKDHSPPPPKHMCMRVTHQNIKIKVTLHGLTVEGKIESTQILSSLCALA